MSSPEIIEMIKGVQRSSGTLTVDGIAGPKTWEWIALKLGGNGGQDGRLPSQAGSLTSGAEGSAPVPTVPQEALALILESEGIDQPSRWPGGASGITIGRGYDLGYEENFARDWAAELSPLVIDHLSTALGLRGRDAELAADRFVYVKITREQADRVFYAASLPKYIRETLRAFPGADRLPPIAFGALVSLVFNRGSDMDGERRLEMRKVRDAVKAGDLKTIALQIRAMKHLWTNQGLDGLLVRRDAEAALVEEAIA